MSMFSKEKAKGDDSDPERCQAALLLGRALNHRFGIAAATAYRTYYRWL
jgi:hypothetical protein